MIANRFNPLGAKSRLTAKYYIQDGLIAMWDGIENAGWGTHDADATVWKDLIGDVDLSLMNGATFNEDSFSSNLTTQSNLISARASLSEDFQNKIQTVECTFMVRTFPYATETILMLFGRNLYPVTRASFPCVFTGSGNRLGIGERVITIGYKPFISGVKNHVGRIRGTDRFFLNGEVAVGNCVNTMLGYNGKTGFITIGNRLDGTSRAFDGNLYNIRLYNRALTDAEIAHNYATDKARFGL